MAIEVDRSEPNLVKVKFPNAPITDEQLAAYLEDSETSLQQRSAPFAIIVDTGERSVKLTVVQRRMQAEFMNRVAPIIRRHCRGYAFVVRDTVGRGVLRAILWFAAPPCPWRVFEDPESAQTWTRGQLSGSVGQSPSAT